MRSARAAEQYVENLHSRLSVLQTRALVFKPYNPRKEARRMPDDLAEDLVRTLNEMRTQNDALAAKDEEADRAAQAVPGGHRPLSRAARARARVTRASWRPEWPKPPAPRDGGGEILHHSQLHLHHRHDHQLRDALAGLAP